MHDHRPAQGGDRNLILAVLVNVLLTVAQVVGGLLSGSLSLVADALHNLSDAAALGIALIARRISRRPTDDEFTFGYQRAEVIGALINLTTLVIVGLYLIYEALSRYADQQPIAGWTVIWVAGIALAVDIGTAILTYRMSTNSLNIRAAFLHNVSDALASVAVIIVGILVLLYEWYWTDLVATVLIAGYVLYQGVSMMRKTIRLAMEGVPSDIRLEDVRSALLGIEGIEDIHHLHVWQLDEQRRALEVHIVHLEGGVEGKALKGTVRQMLEERFRIGHTCLELESFEKRC
jgi:cobalt-zinc-cadmium efflux system protein